MPLFGTEIEPNCNYCTYNSGNDEDIVCSKNNSANEQSAACPEFEYDPLKRTPSSAPPLKSHDPDEFKL